MKSGFYTIMAAQFFSSLADNALLIASIALLTEMAAPAWMTPLLKLFFVISYVLLAAFVGAFADALPKGRVMLITNTIKIFGCLLLLTGTHPLLAYGVVGFGAAAYSPAKYGILTELLPPEDLVAANGWIEGLTVGSIILGTVVGGVLIGPTASNWLDSFGGPFAVLSPARGAMLVVILFYLAAALFNLRIPSTGVEYARQPRNPITLIKDFSHCFVVLWQDRLAQISLAVTTLFWGAGATLQFIVIKWAEQALGLSLSQGALMQAVVAIGVTIGASAAAFRIPLRKSLTVMPYGIAMGGLLILMAFYHRSVVPAITLSLGGLQLPLYLAIAYLFLIMVGALSGYFVVPMNALLQHRGHVLLSAGHSIAVQNFNENLSVLLMLGLYAVLIWANMPVTVVIVLFGLFVCGAMWRVIRRHAANQREFDSLALIGEGRHPHP